jgi:hypothetical protein
MVSAQKHGVSPARHLVAPEMPSKTGDVRGAADS